MSVNYGRVCDLLGDKEVCADRPLLAMGLRDLGLDVAAVSKILKVYDGRKAPSTILKAAGVVKETPKETPKNSKGKRKPKETPKGKPRSKETAEPIWTIERVDDFNGDKVYRLYCKVGTWDRYEQLGRKKLLARIEFFKKHSTRLEKLLAIENAPIGKRAKIN